MIEWLKLLFHIHKYDILAKGDLISLNQKTPYGKWYDCRCTICGKIKVFET